MTPIQRLSLLLILLIVVCVIGVVGARADECNSPEMVFKQIKGRAPMGLIAGFQDFPSFLKRLNAYPPETDYDADQALTFTAEGSDVISIIFFKNGCAGKFVTLPRVLFDFLVTGDPT